MTRRMMKLTAWTISDLSRLINPPPPCSPAAAWAVSGPPAGVVSGPAARAALPSSATSVRAHRSAPSRACPRSCMRRSPRCDERVALRIAEVKTITRRERRQPNLASPCDHPAADDEVAPVPHDGLARRDRPLRTLEHDLGAFGIERPHGRRCGHVRVSDPGLDSQRIRRWLTRDEIHAAGGQPARFELTGLSDRHRVAAGIETEDVEPAPARQPQPLLLPDGEVGQAGVVAELPALAIHDDARLEHRGIAFTKKRPVVSTRNEADLLALRLLGGREPEAPGVGSHLVLPHVTYREDCPGQLLLGERPEEIALILPRVGAPPQLIASAPFVASHPRVVASRHGAGVPGAGPSQQRAELQFGIA